MFFHHLFSPMSAKQLLSPAMKISTCCMFFHHLFFPGHICKTTSCPHNETPLLDYVDSTLLCVVLIHTRAHWYGFYACICEIFHLQQQLPVRLHSCLISIFPTSKSICLPPSIFILFPFHKGTLSYASLMCHTKANCSFQNLPSFSH